MLVQPLGVLLIIIGVATVALIGSQAPASATDHNSVVPEQPRRDVPIVVDGIVHSSVQFADRVIVAGEFSQVEVTRGGAIVGRDNIFAYDINTGAIIDDFLPNANGDILDMVVDEENSALYVGGTFTRIGDKFHARVAKLDYFGNVDPAFTAKASAEVFTVDVADGVLYMGGSFLTVNDEPHDRIAAVDTTLGDSIPNFNYQIAGDLGKAGSRSVGTVEVTNDGSRLLVVFNGQSIVDNQGVSHDRYGVAFINLNSNIVAQYRTAWFENAIEQCSSDALQIQEATLSPDSSFFVVVEKGGFRCDKIVAFPAIGVGGGALTDALWVTAAHDSVFSVGISNNAVYAGGHFCFLEAHGAIPSEQAATYPWVNKPERCESGGNQTVGDFHARHQVAALNPADGEVLDWNPVSNAGVAVFDLEVIDRGLLVGQDNDRINNVRTGQHAFLDFGGTTPAFVPPAPATCTASVDQSVVSLTWDEIAGATDYTVRRNNSFVGTVTSTTFSENRDVGTYSYVIRYRVNGVTTDLPCEPLSLIHI